MKRIRLNTTARVLIAMLVPCGATALEAQDGPPTDTLRLSLSDAVERALSESEEMAAARAQVDQAASQVTQATASALPQLSSNLTYNRAIKTIFDDIGGGPPSDDTTGTDFGELFEDLPFGRPNNYIATFQLSQLLWAGGSVGAARRAATLFRSAAFNQLDEVEADLTLQVRTAYLNAVLAHQLSDIALASRGVAEAHLSQVESFYQAGTTSEFDLLRAQVDLENRDPAVVQAENAVDLAILELKRLVNLPADQPLALITGLHPDMVDVDESALRSLILQRPVLQAANETVQMREAAIKIYRAQRLPSLRLLGNLGFQAFPETAAPPGLDQWREDWSVSLAVSWNPFDGFRTRGQIAEAQALLRQAHVQETQLREGLEVELAAALAEYETARAQIEARHETTALAERTLQLAEVRFSNGLSTQLEVSDAALLLDQARVNEVQARHDYFRALAHLERLSGGRLQLLRLP
jgi:outer membrane protein TolC